MTDNELDNYLIKTLKAVREDYKECLDYVKNQTMTEYKDIIDDYKLGIEDLDFILKEVNDIDDLAAQDDDVIDEVFNFIASYSDNFIIAAEEPQKSRDLEELGKLEELLDLFLDDGEDSEDEEQS